ncbi:MAG: AbrB/MazE/SpoVT family DNA-binding domain-containing protein [Nanoarchaeota archaeon]
MVETVRMSSKGQIVIPQKVREEVNADEGSVFVVLSSGDSIVLKKIEVPSKELLIKSLQKMVKENTKRNDGLGIKESDVNDIVHRYRKSKNK